MPRPRSPSADAPPYRVLLVEDHAIVREGIAHILGTLPAEFTVCGQAADSRTARTLATENQPHLIILDYFLGDGDDGARLLADLRQLCRIARILVLSMTDEDDLAERALRAGAHGYIAKTQGTARLLDACRALLAGGLYVSRELQMRLLEHFGSAPQDAPSSSPLAVLTERELQIFRLLATDLSIENIASRLGLSARTVGSHRENIKNKLGHQTAAQLAAAARCWLQRGGSR